MFLVVWEFEVKPECEERFCRIYGPAGDWVQLFRKDSHYQKTTLVQDPTRKHVYLTLDFWNSKETYEAFKASYKDAYQSLDRHSEGLTVNERLIGAFNSAS